MDFPPQRRVEGARALARAFVLQSEALTRIKNLTMPGYRRLSMDRLHTIVTQVHALTRDVAWEIANGDKEPPMPESKYAPLPNRYWTSTGDNGQDPPINVGIFGERREAELWSRRQNETQRQQEWGRGTAGPMTFTPRPLYSHSGSTEAPDPARPIFPERQWDKTDADDE
jgi:hypothetical protein